MRNFFVFGTPVKLIFSLYLYSKQSCFLSRRILVAGRLLSSSNPVPLPVTKFLGKNSSNISFEPDRNRANRILSFRSLIPNKIKFNRCVTLGLSFLFLFPLVVKWRWDRKRHDNIFNRICTRDWWGRWKGRSMLLIVVQLIRRRYATVDGRGLQVSHHSYQLSSFGVVAHKNVPVPHFDSIVWF